MIWYFGKRRFIVPRGAIIEVCVECRELTRHQVNDEFRQSHAYGIGYGVPKHMGYRCVCTRCREPRALASTFTDVVSFGLAAELDPEEELERTNEPLARHLAVVRRLGALAEQVGPYRGQHDAEMLSEPLEMLDALLFDGRDTEDLIDRLDAWESLDTALRIALVGEIREVATSAH